MFYSTFCGYLLFDISFVSGKMGSLDELLSRIFYTAFYEQLVICSVFASKIFLTHAECSLINENTNNVSAFRFTHIYIYV